MLVNDTDLKLNLSSPMKKYTLALTLTLPLLVPGIALASGKNIPGGGSRPSSPPVSPRNNPPPPVNRPPIPPDPGNRPALNNRIQAGPPTVAPLSPRPLPPIGTKLPPPIAKASPAPPKPLMRPSGNNAPPPGFGPNPLNPNAPPVRLPPPLKPPAPNLNQAIPNAAVQAQIRRQGQTTPSQVKANTPIVYSRLPNLNSGNQAKVNPAAALSSLVRGNQATVYGTPPTPQNTSFSQTQQQGNLRLPTPPQSPRDPSFAQTRQQGNLPIPNQSTFQKFKNLFKKKE